MFNKLKILTKMKIKNLIAVAALLMGSTNAFAQGPGLGAEFAKGGLIYATSNIDAAKLTADATVESVSDNAAGKALIEEKAIEIPATLTVDVDGETWAITVIGVTVGWESAGLDATGIETFSVDETNFAAAYDDFSAFTALKNVTVVDNEKTPLIASIPNLNDPLVLETLDIEKCPGITAITTLFTDGKLSSIKVPATITSIPDNAFQNCEELSEFAFNKDLTYIGEYAFSGTALAAADLTAATGILAIEEGAFQGTALTTFTVPKAVTDIFDYAFDGCAKLATVAFEDKSACTYIGGAAFQGTALSSIELPAGITSLSYKVFAKTKFTEFTFIGTNIGEQAFGSCTSLKTFNFPKADGSEFVDYKAFAGCTYPVKFSTTIEFATAYGLANPPINCEWDYQTPEPETIKISGGFGKWYSGTKDIVIDPADGKVKVYSVYVDNDGDGTAYFQGLKIVDGMYQIPAGTHVIVKSSAEKVEYVDMTGYLAGNNVLEDHMFTFPAKTSDTSWTLAEFQVNDIQGIDCYSNDVYWGWDGFSSNNAPYLYRLTNKNGIGFAQFTGVDLTPGQFFIQSCMNPNDAGRLNVVWLEDDATAIKGVKKAAAEAGAIYNLSGQKVNASYKGVVIKEGKKYIQK